MSEKYSKVQIAIDGLSASRFGDTEAIYLKTLIKDHAAVTAERDQLTAVIARLDDSLADMEDIAHGDLGTLVSQARTLCRLDLREEEQP